MSMYLFRSVYKCNLKIFLSDFFPEFEWYKILNTNDDKYSLQLHAQRIYCISYVDIKMLYVSGYIFHAYTYKSLNKIFKRVTDIRLHAYA